MGKFFIACLATFVVLSFMWNSVAADEESRPAKKLLFDALGMELHDPRKRKYGVAGHHGPRYHGHGKKRGKGRKSGSSGSDSSGSSGSGSSGSDSDSDSDSDGGKRKGKGKYGGHGSDSGHSSDEREM